MGYMQTVAKIGFRNMENHAELLQDFRNTGGI